MFYDKKMEESKLPEQQFAIEKARAILTSYCLFYQNDGFKTALIEQAFCAPIIDPDTNKPIEGGTYSGIIDCAVRRDGLLYLCDHKTVGYLSDDYWHELRTNPQLTQYMLGMRQLDIPIDGFLWDVIQKPTISPKKLTKDGIAEIENECTYCGHPLRVPYAGEENETPSLFGTRVLVAYTETPSKYFQRRVIRRTDDELLEFAIELAADYKEMAARREDKSLCRRNLNACKSFGSLCTFHQLCSGQDGGYKEQTERITDTPHVRKGSLSPSRLATYKLCQRKFWYHYVEKIEKHTRDYNDNLELGSLVHEGLEIYLKARMAPPEEQVDLAATTEQVFDEFS